MIRPAEAGRWLRVAPLLIVPAYLLMAIALVAAALK